MTTTGSPQSLMATLPGHYYTDPAIFSLEQSRIFEEQWFCAVRCDDLDKPGAFRTVQIGRESVLIARGRDGAINAFLNICRHRGARLCTEEKGEVRRSFQCPYHAWTYGLDGKLIAAPNLNDMPDIDRTEFGLNRLHVREWLGYAWVCLAEDPPSFDDTVVSDVTARLGDAGAINSYDITALKLGKRIEYDVKANWKQIIENFMECYHCATIHPELTEVLPEFADGFAAQYYVGHGAEFGEDVQGFTVDGSEGLERLPGVTEDQDRRYYAITVRPQVFINLVPDHVIFHRMFPVAPDRTLIECDWLYLPEVVESGRDLSRSVELFDRVNRQDFDACERCQLAMDSRGYSKGGVFVPSEHHIAEFHDWAREQIGEGSGGE
ncbi:Rieske 2Fe-2S family protein [Saccharopolyspora erythraea NRRL 2338]|uniref:Ferredoxin subunits of nitrite reductase and ring-hydroxylating dioxygenase n=3 Tax=Saccharopolyspora erythraea TaxID=1836 RepID=A4FEF3_SACEN|nr:aromatic ring-hydroxylating dioxygenase subunit alpha [Saccharopolyspora erythraea]PFG96153.1 Rieske 2Fe-2S family protein [Saccharopolyspora erythraea NRRL 2338]QRK92689.1 aromatic ring-hydroxylating dioxygenase subunit alpha [Saccharopolyspora erythraea]CAM02428.1 ferredoxin subunits of nitrite reductase and ring-hydroxylating dioxygenase [Saccharopolyspora erythraea NRRL 2338]